MRVREERLRQHPRRAVERTRVRQCLDNDVLDGSRAFELGPDARRRVEEATPQRQPRLTLRSKLRHEVLRRLAARDHGCQLGVRCADCCDGRSADPERVETRGECAVRGAEQTRVQHLRGRAARAQQRQSGGVDEGRRRRRPELRKRATAAAATDSGGGDADGVRAAAFAAAAAATSAASSGADRRLERRANSQPTAPTRRREASGDGSAAAARAAAPVVTAAASSSSSPPSKVCRAA